MFVDQMCATSERWLPPNSAAAPLDACRRVERWYAVLTTPKHEKSVDKHLKVREVESFLPTFETVRVWKNRQRINLVLPLFPTYLFVRISDGERRRVLQCPGVLRIVGTNREPLPIPDSTISFLRTGMSGSKVEPYHGLVVGQRVRVKRGLLEGLCGVLVRKRGNLRFVLTIDLIDQHAAVEVGADNLEPVVA